MYSDPRQVHGGPRIVNGVAVDPGPNVLRDRPRRDASQFLVGSRTTATFDAHLIDVALGYTYTNDTFRFPISSGVRTTVGGDFTGVVRYAYNPTAAVLPLFETTAQITAGSANRENYLNQGGQTGAKFGQSTLDATTLSLYSGFNIPVWHNITLSPAISYAHATRGNDDTYQLPTRPTSAYNPANQWSRADTKHKLCAHLRWLESKLGALLSARQHPYCVCRDQPQLRAADA